MIHWPWLIGVFASGFVTGLIAASWLRAWAMRS